MGERRHMDNASHEAIDRVTSLELAPYLPREFVSALESALGLLEPYEGVGHGQA